MTGQNSLDHVAKNIHNFLFGPFEKMENHDRVRSRIDALSRPFKVEDINRVLKEEGEEDYDDDAFKPKCNFCETRCNWVLVIHGVCENETGTADDLTICSDCVEKMQQKVDTYKKESLTDYE